MPLDADRLHAEAVVVDMHCDTVIQMKRGYDISKRHATYHIDLPRLKAGGVNLQVFAGCYAPWSSGNAFEVIDRGIDLALGVFSVHSDQMGVCRTASEADKVISSGRLAAMLAIEGGIALEDDPSRVEYFHRRGIRLLTLAHDLPNNWCVNWKDKKPAIDGLNELGREIIGEMNRLGMIIDLSHSAESTFDKVLEVSRAPVLASHSNAHALCPHGRNLTDDQLVRLADAGGMVGVTFVSMFLSPEFNAVFDPLWGAIPPERTHRMGELFMSEASEEEMQIGMEQFTPEITSIDEAVEPVLPSVATVVDHIDHIVNLIGVDHVGLGSDFDGMSNPPVGLGDCSGMPEITRELVTRGYTEDDIRKVLGGNFMRLFRDVCG